MSDNTNIGSQALLVSLSFGLCRQSRQRKREAEEVEERAPAQRGVVKLSSYYFQQADGKETMNRRMDELERRVEAIHPTLH